MRDTGSTRTAMRWLLSSATTLLLISMGCVLKTTRFYTPAAAEARIGLDEMRARANMMLPIECPRVVHGSNSVFATADIALDIDSSGVVQRAQIEHGSGDQVLDDVLGALAAQLSLDAKDAQQASSSQPPPAATRSTTVEPGPPAPLERRRLIVAYSCAPDAGTIALRLQPGPA
jgi:hypothetical protein